MTSLRIVAVLTLVGCHHRAPESRLSAPTSTVVDDAVLVAPADAQVSLADASATPLACPTGTRLRDETWTYMEGKASAPLRWCELPDGTKQGPWRKTLSSGQLVEEAEYDHDQLTGLWTHYFFPDDRGPEQQGHYTNGLKDGVWHTWWGAGVLAETQVFDHGTPLSSISFHPNGQIEERGAFVGGQLSGTWEWFAPDGSPTKLVIFSGGTPVKAWRWKGKTRIPLPLADIDSND